MTKNPTPPEETRTYRISGHRVWREGKELSPAQIRSLAASLAAIARSREQAALRDAYPVGTRVWRAQNPYVVMGYTNSPRPAPHAQTVRQRHRPPQRRPQTPTHVTSRVRTSLTRHPPESLDRHDQPLHGTRRASKTGGMPPRNWSRLNPTGKAHPARLITRR